MTARYNGYFNAKELYKASLQSLEEGYRDNYGQLLPVYRFSAMEDRSSVEPDMDKAIEKVTKVAALHEPSKWVDDCYVLMGKAQYLKGDYESAQETLEYFIDDFNPRDPASRVYQSPNRKSNANERRKTAQRERKIQEEERRKAQKEKEKSRKEIEKERKKARKQREKERKEKQRNRRKGIKTPATAVPQPENETVKEVVADAAPAVPPKEEAIDSDEAYITSLERESREKREKELKKQTTGGFLKHQPAYYEGMMWLVKTYIAREKWLDANYYLDKIEEDPGVPEEVRREVPVIRADLMISQKSYGPAILQLENAMASLKDKKMKARLAFIQAQLYQLNGNAAEAYAAFNRVNDFKPDYEMSLNARLNQLRNAWTADSRTSDAAIKTLEKMAKEDKNASYLGSIYFTMAEIKLAEGDEATAFEYFNQALENSEGSGNQVDIYYRLANLFYGRERYQEAKLYYDSTLTLMASTDERHPIVASNARNLEQIARNLAIIEQNDSLLYLGSLSQEDLNAYARAIVEKEAALKKAKEEESTGGFSTTTTVISGNSKFFAYNQASLQRGRQDFIRRWGDRPLEDDWRRSSRTSSILETTEEEEEVVLISDAEMEREIERVLRGVPRTEEEKSKILEGLEKATFELGTGFRTYIEKFDKSNEVLLGLLADYPNTTHRVEAYFYLYLNYLDLTEPSKADLYLNKILDEFPGSDYAVYLKNPTGDNVLMTEARRIQVYYDQTYELFDAGEYQEAYTRLQNAKEQFGTNHKMTAKYDLLTAMCIGNLKGKDDYVNALRGVSLNHNNTPEQTYAREMLRFLRGDGETFGGEIPAEALENFVVEDSKLHYIIVILYDASGPDVNEVKKQINRYNEKYHNADRLRSTSIYLNQENKTHLILIRRFKDKDESMNYFTRATERKDEFIDSKKYSFESFSVNQKNYREIIKAKSVRTYRAFFEQNYL